MPLEFFLSLATELYPPFQAKTGEFICTRDSSRQLLRDLKYSTTTVLIASYILAKVAPKIGTGQSLPWLHPPGPCGRDKMLAALTIASDGQREVVWSNEELARKIKMQPDLINRNERQLRTELCEILSTSQIEPNPMQIVYKIQSALSNSGIEKLSRLAVRSAEAFSLPPKTLQPDVSPQPFTRLPDFPISETFKSTAKQSRPRRGNTNRPAFKTGCILVGRDKKKSTREETNIPSKNPDIIREGVGSRGRGGNKFELGGFASLVLLSMLAGKHIILGLYRELAVILLSVRSFFHVAIQV